MLEHPSAFFSSRRTPRNQNHLISLGRMPRRTYRQPTIRDGTAFHEFKIIRSVVCFIAVDMDHPLVSSQHPANLVLHHVAMLEHPIAPVGAIHDPRPENFRRNLDDPEALPRGAN